jgi:tryptophan synthase alpha chain
MDRINRAFKTAPRQKTLIPFLNTGDPTFDASLDLFQSVIRAGADIIEVGMPYSDPLADGPVIQSSALRSIRSGFRLPDAFELVSQLRAKVDTAMVLFTYINPLLQYQVRRFFGDARAAGADGIIIPDLPYEESAPIRDVADEFGISLIPLIAPTSGANRIAQIASTARGFVYCVSSLGVTGERARVSDRLEDLVGNIRLETSLPVAVGFGVSTPMQAHQLAAYADGVVVGSAYVRRIEEAISEKLTPDTLGRAKESLEAFTRSLRAAIDVGQIT